jgi:septum formation protein
VKKIILASASPRRRELLAQIGIPFEVLTSDADESIGTAEPEKACRELAKRKAKAVLEHLKACGRGDEDLLIIGADTIVVQDKEILGKPADPADAARMLRLLSGREHEVLTGVYVIDTAGGSFAFSEKTDVYVADLTEADIAFYLSTGEPFDKAGSYGIQGMFARYIEKIDGDYNNVVGLPVGRLWRDCLSKL